MKRPLSPSSPRLGLRKYDRSAKRASHPGLDRHFDGEPWLSSESDSEDPAEGDTSNGDQVTGPQSSTGGQDEADDEERRSSRSTPTASSPVREARVRAGGGRRRPPVGTLVTMDDEASLGAEPPTPTRASHLRSTSMALSGSHMSAASAGSSSSSASAGGGDATDSSGPTEEQARAWAYEQSQR